MKVYLDNCCYNRPYDDQTQIRIHLETEAKLYIQEMIKLGKVDLVTSYVLEYENSKNRFSHKKQAISDFMNAYEAYYVGTDRAEEAVNIAGNITSTGVKNMDALHVACAVLAESDYFVTTDDRLLKYQTDKIQIVAPEEFIRRMEAIDK